MHCADSVSPNNIKEAEIRMYFMSEWLKGLMGLLYWRV
jgi:hypothetical protein